MTAEGYGVRHNLRRAVLPLLATGVSLGLVGCGNSVKSAWESLGSPSQSDMQNQAVVDAYELISPLNHKAIFSAKRGPKGDYIVSGYTARDEVLATVREDRGQLDGATVSRLAIKGFSNGIQHDIILEKNDGRWSVEDEFCNSSSKDNDCAPQFEFAVADVIEDDVVVGRP